MVNAVTKLIIVACTGVAMKWGFTSDLPGLAATIAPLIVALVAGWLSHRQVATPGNGTPGTNKTYGWVAALLLPALALTLMTTGCLSTRTVETWTPVAGPNGTYLTNYTRTLTAKHQDPLKDKVIRATEKSVGLKLQVFPGPAGTSSSFSPLDLLFGMQKATYVSFPVYAGNSNGYTPPLSYAASGAGSLWNDSDVENLATTTGLLPGTNAYYATPLTPVNLLQPITGTVAIPSVTTASSVVTNGLTLATNSTTILK